MNKTDIENLGWKCNREYNNKLYFERGDVWISDKYSGFLEYCLFTKTLKITTTDGGYNSDGPNTSVKYNGKYSIENLKTIIKLLEI